MIFEMKIKLFGKTFIESFNHYIFEFDSRKFEDNTEIKMVEIKKDNINDDVNGVGNTTKKWIINDYNYAKGFYFVNSKNEIIGSCWTMKKEGNEKLYKIRNHDAFIFRLNVYNEYQRKGYGQKIIKKIMFDLMNRNLYSICLACSVNNKPAFNLYKKMGGTIVKHRIFVRIIDKNIPYYTI